MIDCVLRNVEGVGGAGDEGVGGKDGEGRNRWKRKQLGMWMMDNYLYKLVTTNTGFRVSNQHEMVVAFIYYLKNKNKTTSSSS